MAATHILIPIKDIEDGIKILRRQTTYEAQAIANSYESILKNYKQISLDEKDIEINQTIKSVWVSQVSMTFDQYIPKGRLKVFEESLGRIFDSAYKQALKDLL